MINVKFEKVRGYVSYRLKDVNENIERGEALNKPVSFEMEKLITEERGRKKELVGLLDYIKQITASAKEGNL